MFLIDQTVYQTGLVWSEWSGLIRISSGLDRLDHLTSGSDGLDGLLDGLSYNLNLAQTV